MTTTEPASPTPPDPPRSSSGPPGPASRVFQARTPEDLIGFIPVALGFDPAESLVMVRIGAGGPHARLDLPEGRRDEEDACRALLRACALHRVDRVALAVYADHPERWADWVARVGERLGRAGVRVLDVLAVTGEHWFMLLEPGPGRRWRVAAEPERHAYDVHLHPFRIRAMVEGHLVLGSRQELGERLVPDPGLVAETGAALAGCGPPPVGSEAEQEWMQRVLADHASARSVPGPEERARILRNLAVGELRDRAWGPVRRARAAGQVDLWCALVRASPPEQRPDALGVLGYLAWLAGNGALAWISVDLAQERGPHPLARLVTWLLDQAVAPVELDEQGVDPGRPGPEA